jgi:molybdopterin converting factor small subunit
MPSDIRFVLPSTLRPHAKGLAEVPVQADNVREAVRVLVERFPNLQSNLLDSDNEILPFINLFLNQDQILRLDDAENPRLCHGDELLIIPALSGG